MTRLGGSTTMRSFRARPSWSDADTLAARCKALRAEVRLSIRQVEACLWRSMARRGTQIAWPLARQVMPWQRDSVGERARLHAWSSVDQRRLPSPSKGVERCGPSPPLVTTKPESVCKKVAGARQLTVHASAPTPCRSRS